MSCGCESFEVAQGHSGDYTIKAFNIGSYFAYWSSYPDGFCDDNEVGEFSSSIEFKNPLGEKRCYFHIKSGNSYFVAATRLGLIKSLPNLRELGGYETVDRKSFVKYGLLYRADRLCQLDKKGCEQFSELKIKQIVDFRISSEIENREDPVFPGTDYLNTMPISPNSRCFHFTFEEILSESDEVIANVRDALYDQYRNMAFGSAAYKAFFRFVADKKAPILFHCTAGKDRTGVAAALMLMLLGVPRETIIYDYMLTRIARSKEIEQVSKKLEDVVTNKETLRSVEAFMSVQQSSIESTMDSVLERYPNVDDYFINELELTKNELEEIRQMYLTKHIEKEM